MPGYIVQPAPNYFPPSLLIGDTLYLFGSLNAKAPTTRMMVTAASVTADVVTLYVTIVEGRIPVAGALVTVIATTLNSGGLNVENVAIASVTINATTGVGTITYAATTANLAKTADVGYALVPQSEIAEAVIVGEPSICFALPIGPFTAPPPSLTFEGSFSGAPGTFELDIQEADTDVDANYITPSNAAYTINAVVTGNVWRVDLSPAAGKFCRLKVVAFANFATINVVAKVRRSA